MSTLRNSPQKLKGCWWHQIQSRRGQPGNNAANFRLEHSVWENRTTFSDGPLLPEIRELRQRRRRKQRERQKSNRFGLTKQQLCTCIMLLVHFLPSLHDHNIVGDIVRKHGIRGTQREYSSKPLTHSIVKRILVFKQ